MHGNVIVTYLNNENKVINSFSESNMILDGAGELIVDILTVSPSYSSIPSASAILDASNYTIHAVSFGKDAAGYHRHAHSYSLQELYPADYIIRVLSYEPVSVSSYRSSAVGDLLPEYPSPWNTRLESSSTAILNIYTDPPIITPDVVLYDYGHNINSYLDPGASLVSAYVGCYPSKEGSKWHIYSALTDVREGATDTPALTGVFTSYFNLCSALDLFGYINVTTSNAAYGNSLSIGNYSGVVITADTQFSALGYVGYNTLVSAGDLGCLSIFGGVYQMGLWYIDIKRLLSEGVRPPYSFSHLNNPRKYKLFAKKTFSRDLTYVEDSAIGPISGYKYLSMVYGGTVRMVITWIIGFL